MRPLLCGCGERAGLEGGGGTRCLSFCLTQATLNSETQCVLLCRERQGSGRQIISCCHDFLGHELAPSSQLAGDDAGRHQAAQLHVRLEFGRAVGTVAHVQRPNLSVDAVKTERSIVTSGLSWGKRQGSVAPATPGGRPCRPGPARRRRPGGPHGRLWPSRRALRRRSLRRRGGESMPSPSLDAVRMWSAGSGRAQGKHLLSLKTFHSQCCSQLPACVCWCPASGRTMPCGCAAHAPRRAGANIAGDAPLAPTGRLSATHRLACRLLRLALVIIRDAAV